MSKRIIVNLLKLVGGLIFFIAILLLGVFVSSSVMGYCFDKGMESSTALLFSMCSLVFVLGLVLGIAGIICSELYERKQA